MMEDIKNNPTKTKHIWANITGAPTALNFFASKKGCNKAMCNCLKWLSGIIPLNAYDKTRDSWCEACDDNKQDKLEEETLEHVLKNCPHNREHINSFQNINQVIHTYLSTDQHISYLFQPQHAVANPNHWEEISEFIMYAIRDRNVLPQGFEMLNNELGKT